MSAKGKPKKSKREKSETGDTDTPVTPTPSSRIAKKKGLDNLSSELKDSPKLEFDLKNKGSMNGFGVHKQTM